MYGKQFSHNGLNLHGSRGNVDQDVATLMIFIETRETPNSRPIKFLIIWQKFMWLMTTCVDDLQNIHKGLRKCYNHRSLNIHTAHTEIQGKTI